MINELVRGTYKAISLYISDDSHNLRQIEPSMLHNFLYGTEVVLDRLTGVFQMVLTVNHQLIKHTIAKEIDFLNADNIIRLVLVDEANFVFDHTFIPYSKERLKDQGDKSGDTYDIVCISIYDYYLRQTNPLTTAKSYKGTPIAVFENLFKDCIKIVDGYLRGCGVPTVNVTVESNKLSFLDDPEEITFKCQQNVPCMVNLITLSSRYNISYYQDFLGYHIIENPVFSKLKPSTLKDGTALWRENAPSSYPFKICDKIKRPYAPDMLDSADITISLNKQGKKQVTQKIETGDILKLVELNGNADEFRNLFETRAYTESSGTTENMRIIRDYMHKYIQYNSLVIYCTSTLSECNPGTVTSVQINAVTGNLPDMMQGDYRYSGNWLIKNCTFKVVNQRFFIRLVLCRFDNPKKEDYLSNNCAMPRSDALNGLLKPAKPDRERTVLNKCADVLSDLNSQITGTVNEFTDKINGVTKEIQGYMDYANQKINSVTEPVKAQFTNQVRDAEVALGIDTLLSKNRKTLGVVNNILAQSTGINIAGALGSVNEIMNIDAVIKDATLGQIERVYNNLTNQTVSTIKNVSGAVTSAVAAAQKTIETIDTASANIADCELNLDESLDNIRAVYHSVTQTKEQIDRAVSSVKRLKEDVKNIPNTIKLVNPLDVLKEKRDRIIRRVKVQKSEASLSEIVVNEVF